MDNIVLTSIKNPLIKQVRKLKRSQERQKQNKLLIEGTNLIEAACHADYSLDIVFYTEQWLENHQSLWQEISCKNSKLQLVSFEVLKAIATTVNPDGIVAVAPRQIASPAESFQLGIALEKLQDPGNLGTIIRTAVATGVEGMWLSPQSVDYYHPKVLRATAGQWFQLPVATNQDLLKLVSLQRQQGVQIIATTSQARQTYWDIDFSRPSLILLGNEGAGLSANILELADELVMIPQRNQVESLNVAIATALILYEAQRQSAD